MASDKPPRDDVRAFLIVLAGAFVMIAAGYGLGALLAAPPWAHFSWSLFDAAFGAAATAPLLILLYWFMRTDIPELVRFRESQVDFFARIGFRFTPLRIALLSVGAGLSEELLFRGVLQSWLDSELSLFWALLLPNIVFGALHARTWLYAFVAGLIGIYMGVIYAVTGNVLAPIITHTAYDWAALIVTQRAIAARSATA